MSQVLPSVMETLRHKKTSSGFTLLDVICSGAANPDSSVGCYAPDAESYKVFAGFFDPVIKLYHGYDPSKEVHKADLEVRKLEGLPKLKDRRILSTRIRCGRNLKGFAFAPGITRSKRFEAEQAIHHSLQSLEGDLAGKYERLTEMSAQRQAELIDGHFLFKDMSKDPYLAVAGAANDWPEGRGIFMNKAQDAIVWVNEEDMMRIMAMEVGSDFLGVFDRFARLVNALGSKLDFASDPNRGYLGACPTNIGTAMRASVHVMLPKLQESGGIENIAKDFGLSIRGVHGEHSESDAHGTVDVSNKRRIGVSEIEGVKLMYDGLVALLREEDKL